MTTNPYIIRIAGTVPFNSKLEAPWYATNASISADGTIVGYDGTGDGFAYSVPTSTNWRANINFLVTHTPGTEEFEVSADGLSVVYTTPIQNLIPGSKSNSVYDIYQQKTFTTLLQRVNTTSGGDLAKDGRSEYPHMSADGSIVVFQSNTSNFDEINSGDHTNIYAKNMLTGQLAEISVNKWGFGGGNNDSTNARISGDGKAIVFESVATDLTKNDTNNHKDVFLWKGGALTNLSDKVDLNNLTNGSSDSLNADVANTVDDTIVVFETAKGLVSADTDNQTDIYAYHTKTNSFQLVSSDKNGVILSGSSYDASISQNGRYVAFTSSGDSAALGDTNGVRDIYVKDLQTGLLGLVSKSDSGIVGNGVSLHAKLSQGGEWIAFESSATNLTAVDMNGNFSDVFRASNPIFGNNQPATPTASVQATENIFSTQTINLNSWFSAQTPKAGAAVDLWIFYQTGAGLGAYDGHIHVNNGYIYQNNTWSVFSGDAPVQTLVAVSGSEFNQATYTGANLVGIHDELYAGFVSDGAWSNIAHTTIQT